MTTCIARMGTYRARIPKRIIIGLRKLKKLAMPSAKHRIMERTPSLICRELLAARYQKVKKYTPVLEGLSQRRAYEARFSSHRLNPNGLGTSSTHALADPVYCMQHLLKG